MIGPAGEQHAAGVDVLVGTDTEATETARQLLSYFKGQYALRPTGSRARVARPATPSPRTDGAPTRCVLVQTIADSGSWLELRRGWAPGTLRPLPRRGRPLGVLANSPLHQGGAVDADGALKAARLMELCDARAAAAAALRHARLHGGRRARGG